MPLKSKSRSPDPAPTRAKLLAVYRLSDRTLRLLTDARGPLRLTPTAVDGELRYPLTDEARFTLSVAAACPYSFAGPRPPWLRFALMRSMTSSAEDVADDLATRGLIYTPAEVDRVAAISATLIEGLPEPLRGMIAARRRPTTVAEKSAWELLLHIIGATPAYHQPELLEPFYFQDEAALRLIDQVLLTSSATALLRSTLINHAVGYEMLSASGVLWYTAFFCDWSFLRPADEAAHLATLRPSVRAAYIKARGCTLAEFAAQCSYLEGTTQEMLHVSRQLKRRMHGLLASAEDGSVTTALRVIQTIIKIDDHVGKLNPGSVGKELPPELAEIVPDEYDLDAALPTPPEFADPTQQVERG